MWLLDMDPGSSWGIVKSSNVHERWTWSTWSTELSGQAQLAWDPAGLRTLQGHTRLKSYLPSELLKFFFFFFSWFFSV